MTQPNEPATDEQLVAKMEKLAKETVPVFAAEAYQHCARILRERMQQIAAQQHGGTP